MFECLNFKIEWTKAIGGQNWVSKDTTSSWKIINIPALETLLFLLLLEIRKSVRSRLGYLPDADNKKKLVLVYVLTVLGMKQICSSTPAIDYFQSQVFYVIASNSQEYKLTLQVALNSIRSPYTSSIYYSDCWFGNLDASYSSQKRELWASQ